MEQLLSLLDMVYGLIISTLKEAGKPKPANEKMIKHGGGMVSPEVFEWIKTNGWNEVRKAIDFYRQNHS